MSKRKDILNSTGLRTIVILLVIYFSQIYPYYHLHHSHTDDTLEFEVSSHPIDIDIEHPSDHHHDDEESEHPNDHQHTFDKPINWLIVRIQSQRNLQLENQLITVSVPYLITENCNSIIIESNNFVYFGNNYFPPYITRGPPSLS